MSNSKHIQKHLTDSRLLKKNTFKIPLKSRFKAIWSEMWMFIPMYLLAMLMLGAFLPFAAGTAIWVMIAFASLITLMLGWGFYAEGWLNFVPSYPVGKMWVSFAMAPDYYVPQEMMEDFVQEIIDQWDASDAVDKPAKDLLVNVKLRLQDERPIDPLDRVPQSKMIGLTYSGGERTSFVYAPYVLSHGGAGYELRLQMCAALYGQRPEEEDLAWMNEHDLT